ncbi:MAG: formyltransferase family protein [Bacteroidota bacterium]
MTRKRIALIGKNTVAVNALEILSKKEVDIVLVSPNNSDPGEDGWQRSLLKHAKQSNLNILQFPKIKHADSVNYLTSLQLDFIFSIQYDQIINQPVIETAKYGAINLHFAPLPRYRGVSPIGLALLNGESEFGVTLHYMDPGVDTGDIISQKLFRIDAVKNARELYDNVVFYATELFKDSIDDILNLQNVRIPQDNTKALYYSNGSIDFKENIINFNKDTRSLVNWIKAYIFPPFQYPKFKLSNKSYEVIAVNADFRKNKFEKPGTLIYSEDTYFKFATHDSYINLIVK